jgi:AcrR family transcriptional regulator
MGASARANTRRDLLVDAAFDLLGSEGWPGLTVRGVCRAARMHPRYFYQAFADTEELLVAVFDRLVADMHSAIEEAVSSAALNPRARSVAALGAVARFVTDDRRRARVLYTEGLGNDRLNRRRVETVQQFVGLLVPAGDHPAAQVAAHLAVGGFTSALVAWLDDRLDVPLDDLVDYSSTILTAAGKAAARITA